MELNHAHLDLQSSALPTELRIQMDLRAESFAVILEPINNILIPPKGLNLKLRVLGLQATREFSATAGARSRSPYINLLLYVTIANLIIVVVWTIS